MNKIKIIQRNNQLMIDGTNILGFQFSSNLEAELFLEENGIFTNMVKTITAHNRVSKKTVHCRVDWKENPAIITLPIELYKEAGEVSIALFGVDGKGKVINTNALLFIVDESNETITFKPDDRLMEEKVIDVMTQWYEIHVLPKYTELIQKTEEQQTNISERIKAFDDKVSEINKMIENGAFDGATILQGINDPDPLLGKDGDVYINVSTLSWHFFYKENGEWVDKGSIRGIDGNNKILVGDELDIAESKTLFIQKITQAQAIAETRGIAVNEYDVRIPTNQVRISDEINSQGLDEYLDNNVYKIPEGYSINSNGTIIVPDNTDARTLKYDGYYYCYQWLPESVPENSHALAIRVVNSKNGSMAIYADYTASPLVYRAFVSGEVFYDWKLMTGEVPLWSGSAKVGSTVNIAHDINMFTTLRVLLGNSTYQIICPAFISSDFVSVSTNVPSGSSIYSSNVLLQKISEKQISVYNSVYLLNISGSNHGSAKTDEPVVAIYGRP